MGIKEFYKWWEYLSKEPILADRIEIQLATLSLMVSSFGGSKFKHSDFMIVKQEDKKASLESDLAAFFRCI